jgi:uncharacterized membrane protein (DUF485 family)
MAAFENLFQNILGVLFFKIDKNIRYHTVKEKKNQISFNVLAFFLNIILSFIFYLSCFQSMCRAVVCLGTPV